MVRTRPSAHVATRRAECTVKQALGRPAADGSRQRLPVWHCGMCGTRGNWRCKSECRRCAGPSPGEGSGDVADLPARRGAPQQPGEASKWQLTVATYNGSSWKSMQDYLQVTSAQVVLAQETRVIATGLADASQWADRRGWQSLWTPSVPSAAGGPSSGGAAIFVRKELGLRRPSASVDSHQVVPARLVAAVVEAPGYGSILMMSAYLHVGAGLAQDNLTIIAKAAAVAQLHGLPWTLGADFQVLPAQVDEAGIATQAGAAVVAPRTRGTCRNGPANWRVIDYYMVQEEFAAGIEQVKADHSRTPNPHVPVVLTFHPQLCKAEALVFVKPEAIPVEQVFGPRPEPPDWTEESSAAAQLLRMAAAGDRSQLQRGVDRLYRRWANKAESELLGITGTTISHVGRRGMYPRLKWVPIIPSGEAPRANKHATPEATEFQRMRWLQCALDDRLQVLRAGEPALDAPHHQWHQPAWAEEASEQVKAWIRRIKAWYSVSQVTEEDVQSMDEDEEQFRLLVQQAEREADKAGRDSWKQWVDTALTRGAGAAHRFARDPVAWQPETTVRIDGIVTADPLMLLAEQVQTWAREWQAQAHAIQASEAPWMAELDEAADSEQPLPDIEPDQVANAASTFCARTSSAMD